MDDDEVFGPPRIPEQLRMVWPMPSLLLADQPESSLEPLLPAPGPAVQEAFVARQVLRKKHPDLVSDETVYDSVDPSPYWSNGNSNSNKSGAGGAQKSQEPQFGQLRPWYVPRHQRGGGKKKKLQQQQQKKRQMQEQRRRRRKGSRQFSESGTGEWAGVGDEVEGSQENAMGDSGGEESEESGMGIAADRTLVFESRFESGNLRRAVKINDFEYDLIAKPDLYTSRHTQWFFFSVTNAQPNRRYIFNFINMLKPDSLFNDGMQPLMFSTESQQLHRVASELGQSDPDIENETEGWVRCGEDILYTANDLKHDSGHFYTATFSVVMPDTSTSDTIFFAYCYPYTYSDLKRYLHGLTADGQRDSFVRLESLCTTLAGNKCPLLTITSLDSDRQRISMRKGIVVTARVHPGETNASWMMKGVIDYLCGDSVDARILRDNFVFKIVPMLNVDGVVCGNYRCSLAGVDLNRQYLSPSESEHPTIFHLRKMVKQFSAAHDVIMAVDFHGHSRKKNVFMYGCCDKEPTRVGQIRGKIFPHMLWKNADIFSFEHSSFAVQKSKASTARVVYWRHHGIANSFTIEASFAGADFGPYRAMHFDTFLLQKVGHHFCDTILDYCDPDQSAVNAAYREIERRMPLQAAVIPKGLNLELDAGSDSDSDTGVPNAPASVAALLRKANNRRKGTKAGGKTKGRKKARNAGGKKRLAKARSALAMSSSSVGLRSKATAAIRKSDSSFALHRLMVEDSSGSFSAKPQLPPSGINSSGSSRARIGRSDGNGATQGRRKTRSTRASSSGSQGSRGSRGKTLSGRGKAGKTRVRSASSGSSGSQQQSGQQKAITPRAKAAAASAARFKGQARPSALLKSPRSKSIRQAAGSGFAAAAAKSNRDSVSVEDPSQEYSPQNPGAAQASTSPRTRRRASVGPERGTSGVNAEALRVDADFLTAMLSPGTLALLRKSQAPGLSFKAQQQSSITAGGASRTVAQAAGHHAAKSFSTFESRTGVKPSAAALLSASARFNEAPGSAPSAIERAAQSIGSVHSSLQFNVTGALGLELLGAAGDGLRVASPLRASAASLRHHQLFQDGNRLSIGRIRQQQQPHPPAAHASSHTQARRLSNLKQLQVQKSPSSPAAASAIESTSREISSPSLLKYFPKLEL